MSEIKSELETEICKRTRGDITRDALVEAALEIFGRDGYDAASTRDIAERAGTNQALINYHFKGKKGLYLAVFEYISNQAKSGLGEMFQAINNQLDSVDDLPQAQKFEFAISSLEKMTSGLIHMMNSEITKHWSNLILREQQHPTAAFDIMLNGFMGYMFTISTRLIALAKNMHKDSEQARLLSILLFGQIHIFKVSRATVLAHMQWTQFGEAEMTIVEQQIFSNIRAMLGTDV